MKPFKFFQKDSSDTTIRWINLNDQNIGFLNTTTPISISGTTTTSITTIGINGTEVDRLSNLGDHNFSLEALRRLTNEF